MSIAEKNIQKILVVTAVVMTILRFLLNEKGRMSPDSIRLLKFAQHFPVIDNTLTPILYPAIVKAISLSGLDVFWSSKILGIAAMLFMLMYSRKKGFFHREVLMTVCLISFISLFSATLTEVLFLPLILVFLQVAKMITDGKWRFWQAIFRLSFLLIMMYNIRYSALFFIIGICIFGMFHYSKSWGKIFLISAFISGLFALLYHTFFIPYYHSGYFSEVAFSGTKDTATLVKELFFGISTSFNPFIHMANPAGGFSNIIIYGVGVLTVVSFIFLCLKFGLSLYEKFLLFLGISGIICTFLIQYFYWTDPLDYRLLAPFAFPVWLVFFRKIFFFAERKTYLTAFFSMASCFIFIWFSQGNYLHNRTAAKVFLQAEHLDNKPVLFYIKDIENLEEVQLAELISTVNADTEITLAPKDTLKKNTLSARKVLQKFKIDRNKYQ